MLAFFGYLRFVVLLSAALCERTVQVYRNLHGGRKERTPGGESAPDCTTLSGGPT
jgi:hypothetical protein